MQTRTDNRLKLNDHAFRRSNSAIFRFASHFDEDLHLKEKRRKFVPLEKFFSLGRRSLLEGAGPRSAIGRAPDS